MSYRPSKLTPEQQAERRREGARLLRQGRLSQAEIGRELGVSRATISDWAHTLESGGLRQLRRRSRSGRPPKLTRVQQRELLQVLKRGALAAGFETDRWTGARIQKLVEQQFEVNYHRRYLPRLLHQLGWSQQLPLPRAVERDEALIRAWLEHDWPRIKKGAAQRRKDRVFR
jgi:putative transposase